MVFITLAKYIYFNFYDFNFIFKHYFTKSLLNVLNNSRYIFNFYSRVLDLEPAVIDLCHRVCLLKITKAACFWNKNKKLTYIVS